MLGLFVVILLVALGWMICNQKHQDVPVGRKDDAFLLSGQEEVILCEGYIYYCDLLQERALCRYCLDTKETQTVQRSEGILKKTNTGGYYFSETVVYRVHGDKLEKVWKFSEKSAEFVDVCEDYIYYVVKESMSDVGGEGDNWGRWSVCKQSLIEDKASESLFSSADAIRDVVIQNNIVYVITESGVYSVNSEGESVKLCDTISHRFYNDGTKLLFDAAETNEDIYYEILPDGKVKRQIQKKGRPGVVFDGILYYLYEGYLWSKALEEESDEKKVSKLPRYTWFCMDICEDGIVIRQYLQYDIWYYDFETGNMECIILQEK